MLTAIAHSGEGFVRCALPRPMDIDLDVLNWAGLNGQTLTMACTDPDGMTLLRPAKDSGRSEPLGVATWSNAFPGQEGRCQVSLVEDRVSVQVQVTMADGSAPSGVNITTMAATATTDAQGRATLSLWPGAANEVMAFHMAQDSDFATPPVVYSASVEVWPEAGQVVSLALPGEPDEPRMASVDEIDIDKMLDDVDAQLDEHDEYLHRALENPRLSVAARAQLNAWLDRSARDGDRMYEVLGR